MQVYLEVHRLKKTPKLSSILVKLNDQSIVK